MALTLAQVCSRWRSIALDTGLLWTRIQFIASTHFYRQNLSTRLSNVKSRVGSRPVAIMIECDGREKPWSKTVLTLLLANCDLNRFDSIESLELRLPTAQLLKNANLLNHGYSAGELRQLVIGHPYAEYTVPSQFFIDLSEILCIFPTALQIKLWGFGIKIETSNPLLSHLRSLELLEELQLGPAASQLTNLRILSVLKGITFESSMELPNLQELISISSNSNWNLLTAPKLTTFVDLNPTAATFTFIKRHASLREVTIEIASGNEATLVATSVHSQSVVHIIDKCGDFIDWSSISPVNQRLASLIFELKRNPKGLARADFETLVRGFDFCVNKGATGPNVGNQLRGIGFISCKKDYPKIALWRNSSLLRGCVQTKGEVRGDLMGSYGSDFLHQLRWNP